MKIYFLDLFKKYETDDCTIDEDNNQLTFNFSSNFGEVEIQFDFDNNKYVVICSMDEYQYSNLYMCDEDDIDEENLDAWNTHESFTDSKQAFNRFAEIIFSLNSDSDGSLEDEIIELCETNIEV